VLGVFCQDLEIDNLRQQLTTLIQGIPGMLIGGNYPLPEESC
jgi:hypothetical protein